MCHSGSPTRPSVDRAPPVGLNREPFPNLSQIRRTGSAGGVAREGAVRKTPANAGAFVNPMMVGARGFEPPTPRPEPIGRTTDRA